MRVLFVAFFVAVLVSACSQQATDQPKLLELGSGTPSAANQAAGAGAQGTTVAVKPLSRAIPSGLATTPDAVLSVGKNYVADAQAAFTATSMVSYCRIFAQILAYPQDLQACLRMVEVDPALRKDLPAPQDQEALFKTAAQLPLLRRFALCTSTNGLRFITSFTDYDACMPPDMDKALNGALGDAMWKARENAGVGPPAFPYPDPLWSASQLSPEERVAYCAIPAVADGLEGADKRNCLQGVNPNAPAEDSPSGQADPVVDPYTVLLNASRMRSQAERSTLCNRPEVIAALTASQHQECEVGLSPKDPPAKPLTDQDPGYRDEDL
jgi:hypothetical protein